MVVLETIKPPKLDNDDSMPIIVELEPINISAPINDDDSTPNVGLVPTSVQYFFVYAQA